MTVKAIKLKKLGNLQPEKDREVKGGIIAVALFAAGMIIGSGMLRSETDSIISVVEIFDSFVAQRLENKVSEILVNSLCVNIVCIILAFVSGCSCIGLPLAVALPVVKGLGTGFLGGYLFSQFAMSGIGYYLLTILPGAVISNSLLIIMCNSACFMSVDILAVVLSKKQPEDCSIKLYIKKFLIILLIASVASLLDCLLAKAFSYLFVF